MAGSIAGAVQVWGGSGRSDDLPQSYAFFGGTYWWRGRWTSKLWFGRRPAETSTRLPRSRGASSTWHSATRCRSFVTSDRPKISCGTARIVCCARSRHSISAARKGRTSDRLADLAGVDVVIRLSADLARIG